MSHLVTATSIAVQRSAAPVPTRPSAPMMMARGRFVRGQFRLEIVEQRRLAGIFRDRAADAATLLRRPALERNGRAREARPVAEGGNPAPGIVDQVFEVIERAATRLEPLQQHPARRLALVGMAEHDVAVGERRAVLGEFLEAEDDGVGRRRGPGILGRDRTACLPVAVDADGANRTLLDGDPDARLHQLRRHPPASRQPALHWAAARPAPRDVSFTAP